MVRKLFMAALATESNTFSPIPTGRAAFDGPRSFRGEASLQPPSWANIPLIAWRWMAEAEGIEVAEGLCANAQPGGTTIRAVYEGLRDELLRQLRAAIPVDLVLLNLHGAMVAEGYDDCEGDILARVREIVGPGVTVGVELDPHCHLTELRLAKADLIVLYKQYPHTDIGETAEALFRLAVRTALGEVRPVTVHRPLRMLNSWRTPVEPVRSVVAEMTAQEGRDGILSVSYGAGFAWADVPEVDAGLLVIADGDRSAAEGVAERFARRIWDLRHEIRKGAEAPDEAIAAALAAMKPTRGGPVVIADTSDNAGGGAPSDNTDVLRAVLASALRDVALGVFWDPVAVSLCAEAGVGAVFPLRIGGKCGPASGTPVDLRVRVRAVVPDHVQTGLSGGRSALGPSAWVESEGVHLILGTHRQQCFHPDAFTGLGLTLADKRAVVVKSSQHFHAGFAPIASEVRYVVTPNGMIGRFEDIPYTRRRVPYWPKVADPWASAIA